MITSVAVIAVWATLVSTIGQLSASMALTSASQGLPER